MLYGNGNHAYQMALFILFIHLALKLLMSIRCCVTNFFLLWCAVDYIQCPYCQRRFNENAADRHINFCKEQAARISNKGKFSAEAKGKPASRPQVSAWVQLFLKTSEKVPLWVLVLCLLCIKLNYIFSIS